MQVTSEFCRHSSADKMQLQLQTSKLAPNRHSASIGCCAQKNVNSPNARFSASQGNRSYTPSFSVLHTPAAPSYLQFQLVNTSKNLVGQPSKCHLAGSCERPAKNAGGGVHLTGEALAALMCFCASLMRRARCMASCRRCSNSLCHSSRLKLISFLPPTTLSVSKAVTSTSYLSLIITLFPVLRNKYVQRLPICFPPESTVSALLPPHIVTSIQVASNVFSCSWSRAIGLGVLQGK